MISHKELIEILDYNIDTGVFTNKITRNSRAIKNSRAGNLDPSGYRTIRINKVKYSEHRLAWFYVNKTWPIEEIDHINRNRSDNRISNLREATRLQNAQNTKGSNHKSSSYKGVSWDKLNNKWKVQFTHNNKRTTLGRFTDELEAAECYRKKAAEIHGDFAI